MPFVIPPNFVPGTALSATQLNILRDNQAWFYGMISQMNPPFNSIRVSSTDLDSSNHGYMGRKSAQYLIWRLQLHGGSTESEIAIHVLDAAGVEKQKLVVDSNGATAPMEWESGYNGKPAIDLTGIGINDGEFFFVWIRMKNASNVDFEIVYLFNSTDPILP